MEHNKEMNIAESLQSIARKEGITTDEVREEIALAISYALKSNDKDIQYFWKEIPCEGSAPTIEEIIDFLAEKIAKQ